MRKPFLLSRIVLMLAFVSITLPSYSVERTVIDTAKVVKKLERPLIGENVTFLMSSDDKWPRKVPMQQRLGEMNLGIMRFPYGHLGDNYLFTDAPFTDGDSGLRPRVASTEVAPGTWSWAVDKHGYFSSGLDFDEFMGYAKALDVEPLIMVNMLGYDKAHYPGTVVSFDELKTHAVEWVRYANITRGYGVKYWQLGNEVAMHTDKDTYVKNFVEIASAMKAVDPSIHIGFGEDGRADWLSSVLSDESVAQYIDFLSPHQYLHGRAWTESYRNWRDFDGNLTSKIERLQRYAAASPAHKDVPMIITEYGVTGGNYPELDPLGDVLLRARGNQDGRVLVGPGAEGKALARLWRQPRAADAIYVQLLKSGGVLLRSRACGGCFLTAGKKPADPITFLDKPSEQSLWQLVTAKGDNQYHLRSEAFPNRYVRFDQKNNRYTLLAGGVGKAERFFVEPLSGGEAGSGEQGPAAIDSKKNYANDLWKSLVFAELTLSTSKHKNVTDMVHWNTHSPWEGEWGGGHGQIANSLNNTPDNSLTPIGEVIKFINNRSYNHVLQVKEKHGYLRLYASFDPDAAALSVMVLNKNDRAGSLELDFAELESVALASVSSYRGEHPEDEFPVVDQGVAALEPVITEQGLVRRATVPALSLTQFDLKVIKDTR
ncbi:hypothetical protein KUV95_05090 [Microbulbifer agarilyticus]|uniref:glycoside hydrolase family 2 TIM barrel-domain containing protein n=1 Tax=Microbulbifer agarilyticus TaxID=260552 RepID=UPI001C97BB0E|nr:glycoside hydrolase family 2 TIM barrel-domain containing protein [Microbulbifer agarilyticus]MBY6210919.1 hypothetical protein [Microbulbifer agarilyticus]